MLFRSRLANGGQVAVDIDAEEKITLDFDDIKSSPSAGKSDKLEADILE